MYVLQEVSARQSDISWRQSLEALGKANQMKKIMSVGMSVLFNNPSLYNTALKFAPFANIFADSITI